MGVQKQVIKSGNNMDWPRQGDIVTMEYTGYLYDPSQAANGYRGVQFDTSVGRGDLTTKIGVGQIIRGWDEGILGSSTAYGMSLGEKATLMITSDYGYGSRGFLRAIPPDSSLIFDVTLKAINGKRAYWI
ncbi:FKBP-type peptidyl-prolyl isomeras-like protein [Pseudovirgaria hyperparasitica]|uniref:peptidylprolyl isomerase n=1 Tax=Pseudovirgaria hyperparasitica TaxID=470096 RepID=A0A6A6WL11_9PEZI|nr:FKBP-type peptidyl-prolyl isomeras-like protein [Pseudovirgaria hyperparasitica]KAF2762890.1 FKBP-type peptidyl-prolyl isomeras-like protein [Pseudovirgaria hyperparasitica]